MLEVIVPFQDKAERYKSLEDIISQAQEYQSNGSFHDSMFFTVAADFSQAEFEAKFNELARLLSPYCYVDHFKREKIQYANECISLFAEIATLQYFFPKDYSRKIVVARPLECISLLQLSCFSDSMVVSAYLRSSAVFLFALDFLFVLSIPSNFKWLSHDVRYKYIISVNNFHYGRPLASDATTFTPSLADYSFAKLLKDI